MVWGKMDDKFHRNRKVRELRLKKGGREALGVWSFWWSWCLDDPELTGVVPACELSAGDEKAAKLLVEVGLWDEVDEGYRFHDFHDYNPTREQLDRKREADRTRVASKRGASREDVATDTDATNPRVASPARVPVPSRPDPSQGEKSAPSEPTLGASTTPHPSRLLPVLLEELGSEAFERNLKPAPSAPPSQLQAAAARVHELVQAGTFPEPRAAARALVRAGLDLVRDHKRPFGLALLDATVAGPAAPYRDHIQPWDSV